MDDCGDCFADRRKSVCYFQDGIAVVYIYKAEVVVDKMCGKYPKISPTTNLTTTETLIKGEEERSVFACDDEITCGCGVVVAARSAILRDLQRILAHVCHLYMKFREFTDSVYVYIGSFDNESA